MKNETQEILRRCDEADAYEFPRQFDYALLERRALAVDRRLKEELGERTTFEGASHNQDASFSIAICLHAYEQSKAQGLYLPCLRFSNFGSLVSVTWSDLLPVARLAAIIRVVQEEGFIFVPEDDLACAYDGVMSGKFETWWIRYFDWL